MPTGPLLILHRNYTQRGGEDLFLEETFLPALAANGIAYECLTFDALFARSAGRLSDLVELLGMVLGWERLRPSYWRIRRVIREKIPRALVFNNFIPTLSLAAPAFARARGIPVFTWVHNGRLSCANGLFYDGHAECYRCFSDGSHAVLTRDCFSSRTQKLIYAWIYRYRRVFRTLGPALSGYLVCSDYSGNGVRRLSQAVPAFQPRVHLLRPPVPPTPAATEPCRESFVSAVQALPQPFYAFVGRVSYEKGADQVVELARRYPQRGFVLAGAGPLLEKLRQGAPANVFFPGFINLAEKQSLYREASAVIVPSRVPENASLVVMESEPFRTPIVYPRGGGAEESVKFFQRSGCALDEFRGQLFARESKPPMAWGLREFGAAADQAIRSS